jgi:hypothetical protein
VCRTDARYGWLARSQIRLAVTNQQLLVGIGCGT